LAARLGVAKSTYIKIQKGDPTVAMGTYAMAFFVLGFDGALEQILDQRHDAQACSWTSTACPSAFVGARRPGRYDAHHRSSWIEVA
jgi:hypothetical protein